MGLYSHRLSGMLLVLKGSGKRITANCFILDHGLGARDDATAMQFLIPGWEFDNKRPALVR